ncbi:AAA family ATPase, partial [Candidatus Bipolaricaulota bacterium]|nr:AAA family ATPase [Candidatus Bipolaricaulota bacterium]
MELKQVITRSEAIVAEISKAIVGKEDVLKRVIVGILAGGHILFEDYPGLAKTLIARCFAQVLGIDFKRIQFTPDLLPTDITGSHIFNRERGEFVLSPGPIFANIILADEINRATPKTQSALLEAMQEGQVSISGETLTLPQPFVVIATQNPIEYEG